MPLYTKSTELQQLQDSVYTVSEDSLEVLLRYDVVMEQQVAEQRLSPIGYVLVIPYLAQGAPWTVPLLAPRLLYHHMGHMETSQSSVYLLGWLTTIHSVHPFSPTTTHMTAK